MRWAWSPLLLGLLPGCLLGAGPVVAVRSKAQVAIGWEASANLMFAGIEGGNTFAVNGGPTMGYFAFRSTVPLQPSSGGDDAWLIGIDEENEAHLNLMFGGGGADDRRGIAAGAGAMVVYGSRSCGANNDSSNFMFTVSLGLRSVAGMTELFIAPKANVYEPLCFD